MTDRMTRTMRAVRDDPKTPIWLWAISVAGLAFFGVVLYRTLGDAATRWPYYGMVASALVNPTLAKAIGKSIGFIAGPAIGAWKSYRSTGKDGAA